MPSGSKPEPHLNPRFFWQVLHAAVPYFRELSTFSPIKYFSSACITIWYILKRCSFACSFTSSSPICDQINIHWFSVKECLKFGVFRSDPTNTDRIAIWRQGGERICKTASFMYISYCDTIRTQILNYSQSAEFANLWNRPKHPGVSKVQCFDGVKPVATVPGQFQPGPGTELRIWNRY